MGITKKMLSNDMSRQLFLTGIIIGYSALAGVVLGIPIIGYFLTPLIKPSPRVWRDIGAVDKFVVGSTVEVKYVDPSALPWSGTTNKIGAWLRRDTPTSFTAYSIYCTHLGCPVHWLQSANLFLCPCHGSAFYGNGQVAAGPAQLPLVHIPVRVRNNRVELQTKPIPVIG